MKQPNQFKLALLTPKSLVFVLKNKHNLSVKAPLNSCLFIGLFCLVGVFLPADFSDWEAFCFCDKGELVTGTCNKPGLNFHLCSTHMVQVASLNSAKTAHLNPGIAILESQFILLVDFDENLGKSNAFPSS